MKFATITLRDTDAVVVVDTSSSTVAPITRPDGSAIDSMQELIERAAAGGESPAFAVATTRIPFGDVTFKAALPQPRRNILCVGKNYREHAREFTGSGFDSSASSLADAIPTKPIIFTKFAETVIGPTDAIRYPHGASEQLDYEAELGVIIGRAGIDISREDAMDHVFGYTIVNDVTARDRQAGHKQWFLGKSLDTFCPMGPWIASREAFDLATAKIRCWVNGELRQDACTADLIFDVPTLIQTISQGITLRPGDVIATGTPAGVGIGFKPPKFLAIGDVIAVEIDGLGRIENTVR